MRLTKAQASKFLLRKHGLVGRHIFSGRSGILSFIEQAGCIQYDPIDICGRNADLVLQSRIEGYKKTDLYELLYSERKLIDYWDKNMSVISVSDWPHFQRTRTNHEKESYYQESIFSSYDRVREALHEKGPCCSKDIGLHEKVRWPWGETRTSRAALESLYFRGELIVHHKKGTVKYYDFAYKWLPGHILSASDPNKTEKEYFMWHVKRRIGSAGMLWNGPSDAFLYIRGLGSKARASAFESLRAAGDIANIEIEGISKEFFMLSSDIPLLERTLSETYEPRLELIAPLDNLIWDRKLIEAVFGFEYRWEIYSPPAKRKYGYYVIPMLYGERFIGRAEPVCERGSRTLRVKNIWLEQGQKLPEKEWRDCIERFSKFNECNNIIREDCR